MGWRDVFQESNFPGISEKSERLPVPRTNISDISHFPVAIKAEKSADRGTANAAKRRAVTPAELDELFKLLPLVAKRYGSSDEELAEMRTAAARDPSGALVSFRTLAGQLGIDCKQVEPERFLTADQWLSLGSRARG